MTYRNAAHTGNNPNAASDADVQSLREQVDAMKLLINDHAQLLESDKGKKNRRKCTDSIINGSFLSAVFTVTFLGLLCVSCYAFKSLYYAILKKFPAKGTEEL